MAKKFYVFGFDHPVKAELEHLLSIEKDLRRASTALLSSDCSLTPLCEKQVSLVRRYIRKRWFPTYIASRLVVEKD